MNESAARLNTGWNASQIENWHRAVTAQGKVRDYGTIVSRLQALPANTHTLERYAVIDSAGESHPAFCVTVGDVMDTAKPTILITGGVHGYEPSGVEAAVRFLEQDAPRLKDKFNFVVYPCLSPWAYEYDERWNHQAEDPNRQFSRAEGFKDVAECRSFMNSIESKGLRFAAALDLHETSDRDIELRRMRSERFGTPLAADYKTIPQGYYLIMTEAETAEEFQQRLLFGWSIIGSVGTVSPIAHEEFVLGKRNYAGATLSPPTEGFLRTYLGRHAEIVAVTEAYPDHPAMTPEKTVRAQLNSIHGALEHLELKSV